MSDNKFNEYTEIVSGADLGVPSSLIVDANAGRIEMDDVVSIGHYSTVTNSSSYTEVKINMVYDDFAKLCEQEGLAEDYGGDYINEMGQDIGQYDISSNTATFYSRYI